MVCVLSHVTAAGTVMLGQYAGVREELNQESCSQRGHCSWAWGLSGWDCSLVQAVLHTASGTANLGCVLQCPCSLESLEDITPGLLLPAALRGERLTHCKHPQAELEQLQVDALLKVQQLLPPCS